MHDEVKRYFRPEFLNRIDDIIIFNSLSKDDLYKIIDLQLSDLKKNLNNKNNSIRFSKNVKDFLLRDGSHREWGARPIRRIIQSNIENVISYKYLNNEFHDSYYLPTYNVSEQCLPCHDLVVRDVEAEITFTEWDRIPGFSMFGGIPCQSCHMPEKEDGTHDHTFIGVDMDLNIPYLENPLYEQITNLLSESVEIRYELWGQYLPETISPSDTLLIPVVVESLTAHSIPSGTSFNREAWLEITVINNENIIYSSGLIDSNDSILDYDDENLLLFRSYLKDENGNDTQSVIDTHDIINNSLPAYSLRFKSYIINLPENINGELLIKARMLFRPFNPEFLANHHEPFLQNLPVFEMYSLESTIIVE